MKKFKQVVMEFGAPVLAFALPALALAQVQPAPITAPGNINNINQITSSSGVICTIINWFFWLLIVLTIIFVLVAAFKYLTAGGDPEKVKSAGLHAALCGHRRRGCVDRERASAHCFLVYRWRIGYDGLLVVDLSRSFQRGPAGPL